MGPVYTYNAVVIRRFLYETGRYLLFLKQVFTRPVKWRLLLKQFMTETEKLVLNSIPLIALISIFIGAVLVIQTSNNMTSPFLPKMYIGYMARESLVLEFCSTMVCLILAGKIGSNVSSELGTMRITEQIDAMDMMGVNSANYLILPKVAASVTLSPFLMLISFVLGLIGGAAIVIFTGIITFSQYIDGLQFAFKVFYIYYSMIKMAVFGFIITSVAAFFGYYATGGSLGVGRSSTKAIVVSSVLILIFDLVLTELIL